MRLGQKVMMNAGLLAAGRVLVAAMGIVGVGVTTRYLNVNGFGALATATAFMGIVAVLSDLGLTTIAAREMAKRPDETQRIVGSILTIGLVTAFVGGAIAVALAFAIYPGEQHELIRRGILLLLLTAPLTAPAAAANAYFVSEQRAYVGMLGSVLASAVTLGGVVLVSALDWGFTGVLLAYVAAAAVQGALMIAFASRHVRLAPVVDLALARRLVLWMLPLAAAVVIHQLYWRVDMIMLSLLDTQAEVALYGLCFKMLDALVVLPGFVLITLLPEFARLAAERARFGELMQKAFDLIQVATFALVVVFVSFASEVVHVIGGPDFLAAAPVLQILMIAIGFSYFGGLMGQGFVAHNRQGHLVWILALALLVNVGLNLALIPAFGARGAAIAFAASEGVGLAGLLWVYRGFARIPRPRRLPQVLTAAAAMGSVALLKLLPFEEDLSPVVVLLGGATLALAVYVAALYALRAMPREVHTNVVIPLWARLRPQ